jgi:hypothetical protein
VSNSDSGNQQRYARFAEELGVYGVFRLDEGGIFRHHSPDWIRVLLAEFKLLDLSYVDVRAMNGNPARAFQYLGWYGQST